MFSELNKLVNISDDNDYAAICGITLPELKDNFVYGIRKFAEREECTPEELVDRLREQYDDYHFTKGMVDVFNPFSLLNAFSVCEMNSYWFQTGTPSFAINILRAHKGEWNLDIENIEGMEPMPNMEILFWNGIRFYVRGGGAGSNPAVFGVFLSKV
jgi:hypothetical protein